MPKSNGHDAPPNPVFAVGLGRGFAGKSTILSEIVWRARSAGREVIVADGDHRSRTLSKLFPEATTPASEESEDVKEWLSDLLNRMAKEKRSAVLDLGGGDRTLIEYGRDLMLVDYCQHHGIDPLALYCLGPEEEDLQHIVALWDGGYFRPPHSILILNEGIIRQGKNIITAFKRTMESPDFARLVKEGAKPVLLDRLACIDKIRQLGAGFYGAAAGEVALDPVESFMCLSWLKKFEEKRVTAGVASWLP